MALVEAAGLDEGIRVPLAVARMLQRSEEQEPGSRAELVYRVRSACDACAWASIVDMASRREHSEAEARSKLSRAGYSAACVDATVGLALKKRVIDDARFCDSFIRSGVSRGWGQRKIESELRQRGIEADEIRGWPDEFLSDDDQRLRAKELLERKSIPEKNPYQKLMRFLVSRGYDSSLASDVVRERLS